MSGWGGARVAARGPVPCPSFATRSRLPGSTSVVNARGVDAGGISLSRLVANGQLVNGSGEVRASWAGRLDPINSIRRAVGLDRFRIVPADVATGQKTAISAGKYVTRKLFVEVITDGQGYSATRAEFQMTRWLSLLSSISTIGRASTNVRISRDY